MSLTKEFVDAYSSQINQLGENNPALLDALMQTLGVIAKYEEKNPVVITDEIRNKIFVQSPVLQQVDEQETLQEADETLQKASKIEATINKEAPVTVIGNPNRVYMFQQELRYTKDVDVDIEFKTFKELSDYIKLVSYNNDESNIPTSGYDKFRLEVKFGKEPVREERIDIGQSDFNPFKTDNLWASYYTQFLGYYGAFVIAGMGNKEYMGSGKYAERFLVRLFDFMYNDFQLEKGGLAALLKNYCNNANISWLTNDRIGSYGTNFSDTFTKAITERGSFYIAMYDLVRDYCPEPYFTFLMVAEPENKNEYIFVRDIADRVGFRSDDIVGADMETATDEFVLAQTSRGLYSWQSPLRSIPNDYSVDRPKKEVSVKVENKPTQPIEVFSDEKYLAPPYPKNFVLRAYSKKSLTSTDKMALILTKYDAYVFPKGSQQFTKGIEENDTLIKDFPKLYKKVADKYVFLVKLVLKPEFDNMDEDFRSVTFFATTEEVDALGKTMWSKFGFTKDDFVTAIDLLKNVNAVPSGAPSSIPAEKIAEEKEKPELVEKTIVETDTNAANHLSSYDKIGDIEEDDLSDLEDLLN